MNLKLSLALIASLFCLNVRAENICSIDHVEKFEGGIHVVFMSDIHPDIQGIKRSGSTVIENVKAGAALVLKEGDESGIHGGPHDSCVVKAEKRENKLGLLAVSNSHIPGVPSTTQTQFILPSR